MARLFDLMAERGYQDRLNVVMERGHKNVWDCERIFNDLRSHCKVLAGSDFLGEFSVRPKEDCPPLMVADLLAASYSMFRSQNAAGTLNPEPFKVPHETKGRLAWLEFQPGALNDLKVGFELMRQRKIEHWRAQKAAKKASSSEGGQLS